MTRQLPPIRVASTLIWAAARLGCLSVGRWENWLRSRTGPARVLVSVGSSGDGARRGPESARTGSRRTGPEPMTSDLDPLGDYRGMPRRDPLPRRRRTRYLRCRAADPRRQIPRPDADPTVALLLPKIAPAERLCSGQADACQPGRGGDRSDQAGNEGRDRRPGNGEGERRYPYLGDGQR